VATPSVKERILRLATHRFAELGFQATTMRSIASRAGVTLPTIYHYFGDKERLYLEVCIATFAPRAERARENQTKSAASNESKILGFFVGLCTELLENENYFKLLHREMIDQDDEGIRLLTERCWTASFTTLANAVSALVENKSDPFEVTFAAMALMLGLVEFRRKAPYLHKSLPRLYDPLALAVFVLNTTLPQVNWSGVTDKAA
jgi:AcrR family transcriptional regulator